METKVHIRAAALADAQRIHELHLSSVRTLCAPHYEPHAVDGWLNKRSPKAYLRSIESSAIFVAEMDSKIVGFGESTAGEVLAVFVDPGYAGRGIGTALLRHALRFAQAEQNPVRVESTLNAVPFYERFGFRMVE